jgi:ribulose 1,5-bisphosphate synthetase/thiazole synthase
LILLLGGLLQLGEINKMYAVDFVLKNDNKQVNGLIWDWSPESSNITVLDESNGDITKYNLNDILSGVYHHDRIRGVAKQEDLLQKAINEGYKQNK